MSTSFPITARYNQLIVALVDSSVDEYDEILSEIASIEVSGMLEEEASMMPPSIAEYDENAPDFPF